MKLFQPVQRSFAFLTAETTDAASNKANLICIQWFVAIATSYLLLFRQGTIVTDDLTLSFITAVLAFMLVLQRLPPAIFSERIFSQCLVIVDTLIISGAIALNKETPWDLLLIFFFGIFIAALGETLLRIALTCLILSVVSVFVLPLSGHQPLRMDPDTLLRIPLLFGASLVYGYMAEQVNVEKKKTADLEESRRRQLQVKDQFLSHVSHELRTPLSAIYQFVTILRDGLAGDINDEQREYLNIIYRNIKQLQGMISDLLDATRADAGKLAIDRRQISARAVIRETVQTLTATASAKAISLTAEVPESALLVFADPQRLRQILTNLVENAIKFTPGGGRVRVEAGAYDEDPEFVRISVADTGCGVDPDSLRRIFERLYQETKIAESRMGLGLGLFICKELVELHGGRIWVESETGKGTVFHFTLPIVSVTKLLAPLFSDGGRALGQITLLQVEFVPANGAHERKLADNARRQVWNILQSCVTPGKNVLLPGTEGGDEREVFFIVERADQAGGPETIRQIREQLGRYQELENLSVGVNILPTVIANGGPSAGAAGSRVERVVQEIEKLIAASVAERPRAGAADLVGATSQRLRNPLNVIVGYASILRDKLLGELTLEQENALDQVMGNTYDVIMILNNVLEAQRIEAGISRVERQEVDLARLLSELRQEYGDSWKRSVRMSWDCPPGLPQVTTDGTKIRLIVQNLIHNALKLTEQGSVTISARLVECDEQRAESKAQGTESRQGGGETRRQGDKETGRQGGENQSAENMGQNAESKAQRAESIETEDRGSRIEDSEESKIKNEKCKMPYLEVTVSDTGAGISPDEQAAIFDRFYQPRFSETDPLGTAVLELYMVKTLTELLGGEVTVQSAPQKGSTFRVAIPIANHPIG
jgi:signal transduction histidine kinase